MSDTPAPSPFSIPLYKRIWVANIASQFGGLIQSVGAAWLMVQLGGSETQIALVQASVTLPIMILSLISGAVADNFPRRTVMLMAQVYMFAVSALLCLSAFMGWLNPWMLLVFTFLIGCGTALNAPSWQATVGDIVPRNTIAAAVAMNSLGFNIARTAGPALGGAIVAAAGAAAAFAVNVFSYLGIIYVLLAWKPEKPLKPTLKEDLRTAMAAGVRYVSMSPPIRKVMARAALFGIAASAVLSLLPLVARELLGGSAITFGMLSGAFGIGAVIGALSNARLRRRFSAEMVLRMTISAIIAGVLIVAFSRWLPLTFLGLVICGSGWLLSMATMNITVQMSAPRWVVGRALSLYQMALFGAMAVGSWITGRLAEHYGVTDALLIMAAAQSLSVVAGIYLRLPIVEDLNLDLKGRWQQPDIKVPVEPRSGPVHVSIEYRILEADIPRFLSAMNERRRIHLRDGARAWSLIRDLTDPEVWKEQYSFARWLDYVLHNERRTHADDVSINIVKSLHQGSWPPVVRRMLERQVTSVTYNPDLTSPTSGDPTRPA
ncbi:MFS transporter [Hyphomonas sp. WL0036]|uniref:MFS transporter n=1 Tax=Hyphomonas sediminis TaxID=2866160 RepID=UPI001C7FE8C2|nr:MFS transporter [Hyphomonas sediminis]MBY9068091.1 MFS transporter [Hyphomonas sediminis]